MSEPIKEPTGGKNNPPVDNNITLTKEEHDSLLDFKQKWTNAEELRLAAEQRKAEEEKEREFNSLKAEKERLDKEVETLKTEQNRLIAISNYCGEKGYNNTILSNLFKNCTNEEDLNNINDQLELTLSSLVDARVRKKVLLNNYTPPSGD